MRVLILTVAGLSTRFSESLGYEVIKCIYHEKSFSESLLFRMLQRHEMFDKIVIVGGYRGDELKETIDKEFAAIADKIRYVINPFYSEYGSGYSLFVGYEAIKNEPVKELVFVEGDLFFDDESFLRIVYSKKDVITYTNQPVLSNKSVAFYLDVEDKIHYIFDTAHNLLMIEEPFKAIYNSGQVCKLKKFELVKRIFEQMSEYEKQGTNLIPINKYFNCLIQEQYETIGFKEWINCNTVDDFRASLG